MNLPFVIAAPGSWWTFFSYNHDRPADWDSLWFVACNRITRSTYCGHTGAINLASLMLFVAVGVALWHMRSAVRPDFERWTFGFPLLVVFLLTNKVYSPQYGLWLLPWFALALPDLKPFIAFEAADVAVFLTRFSLFARYSGMGGWPIGAFEIAVVVRAAILVWCLVAWVLNREPGPVRLPQPATPAAPSEVATPTGAPT